MWKTAVDEGVDIENTGFNAAKVLFDVENRLFRRVVGLENANHCRTIDDTT